MSHSNLDPLASFTLCKLSFTFLHLLPGSQSYPLKQGDIRWLYQVPQISGLRTPQRGKSLAPVGSCFSPSTCSHSIFGYNYIPWPLHTGRSSVFSVHIHRLLRNLLLLDSEIPQAHRASWSPSAPPPWLLLQAQGLNSPLFTSGVVRNDPTVRTALEMKAGIITSGKEEWGLAGILRMDRRKSWRWFDTRGRKISRLYFQNPNNRKRVKGEDETMLSEPSQGKHLTSHSFPSDNGEGMERKAGRTSNF